MVKGGGFTRAVGKKLSDAMVVSKGITLFTQMATFNEDIR